METKARITDLPQEERPREKLAQHGCASLSSAELLAIFLRVGTAGKSAIAIAQDLLQKHGSLTQLSRLSHQNLSREHGLGPAKASQILAACELGRRLAHETHATQKLDRPEVIHAFLGPELRARSKECLQLLLLNTRLHLIRVLEIASGSPQSCIAHPRDILEPVISHQAHAFVLIHNHPSGDPHPSMADKALTRQLLQAAQLIEVQFLDHLIIGLPQKEQQAWFSFQEAGWMSP